MENINEVVNEQTTQNIGNAMETAGQAAAAADPSLIADFFSFLNNGGVFMYIILAMWLFGLALAIQKALVLVKLDTNPESIFNQIKKFLIQGDVSGAINDCSNKQSLVSKILKNMLLRANQNREKIEDVIESTYLEHVTIAEKRIHIVSLLANVSTLIGLLGTIQGLIQSFAAVADADPSQKASLLASGIATAMNTTALGLISAISLMFIHNYLNSKAQKIISDNEEYSIKLLDILTSKKAS
jgi:biopolymer transport protein ExbB/TolQ